MEMDVTNTSLSRPTKPSSTILSQSKEVLPASLNPLPPGREASAMSFGRLNIHSSSPLFDFDIRDIFLVIVAFSDVLRPACNAANSTVLSS